MKIRMLIFAFCLFATQSVFASPGSGYSGADLLQGCTAAIKLINQDKLAPAEYLKATRCIAFVSGFYNGYMIGTIRGKTPNPLICAPKPEPTGNQLIRVVELFARTHPQVLNDDAAVITGVALAKAFPCSKK